MENSGRKVVPVNDAFFNDGHWYVVSSSSLGGSGLSAEEIAEKLQTQDAEVMKDLLRRGVCLPLYFGCDCALDSAIFVLGDLNQREEAEWFGRIRAKLEIPCGEFMLMGGAMDEDFEVALPNFEPPDVHFQFFHKLKLDPGSYLVEVYAFLGSYPLNEAWEDPENQIDMEQWWDQTRPGEDRPEWISFFNDEEYVDSEEFDLVEHIIRIVPTDEDIPIPILDKDDTMWVGDFEMRRPEKCPTGLKREEVLGQV